MWAFAQVSPFKSFYSNYKSVIACLHSPDRESLEEERVCPGTLEGEEDATAGCHQEH